MSYVFFFSSRRRHTRCSRDWSSDVCSSDLSVLGRLNDALGELEKATTLQPDDPSVHQLLVNLRSEEHTSELQSRLHLVCRLLLEKKKASTNSLQHSPERSS